MRQYQTYLVRLLIDTEARLNPELRGSLKILGEGQTYPFKSGPALLDLLIQFNKARAEKPPIRTIPTKECET